MDRHSCYMVRTDELYNEVTQDASGKAASQGMFVGCFLDTATGIISFTCEGKETKHKFKVILIKQKSPNFINLYLDGTRHEIVSRNFC